MWIFSRILTFLVNKYSDLFVKNVKLTDFLNSQKVETIEDLSKSRRSERIKQKETKSSLHLEIPKIKELVNNQKFNFSNDTANTLLEFKRQMSNSSLNLKDEPMDTFFNFGIKNNSDFSMTPWKKETTKQFFKFTSDPSYQLEKNEEPLTAKEEKLSVIEVTPKFKDLEKLILSREDQ